MSHEMTLHDISPAFCKINYNTNGHVHVMQLPMLPDTVPTVGVDPQIQTKVGSAQAFSAAMDTFASLLTPILNTGDEISTAEFWYKPTAMDDPLWIFTHSLAAAGDSATAAVFAQQYTLSFRTVAGGVLKLTVMETVVVNNVKNAYPFASTPSDNLGAFCTGDDSPFIGRDGAFPAVPIFLTTKTNNRLRKKYQVIS